MAGDRRWRVNAQGARGWRPVRVSGPGIATPQAGGNPCDGVTKRSKARRPCGVVPCMADMPRERWGGIAIAEAMIAPFAARQGLGARGRVSLPGTERIARRGARPAHRGHGSRRRSSAGIIVRRACRAGLHPLRFRRITGGVPLPETGSCAPDPGPLQADRALWPPVFAVGWRHAGRAGSLGSQGPSRPDRMPDGARGHARRFEIRYPKGAYGIDDRRQNEEPDV